MLQVALANPIPETANLVEISYALLSAHAGKCSDDELARSSSRASVRSHARGRFGDRLSSTPSRVKQPVCWTTAQSQHVRSTCCDLWDGLFVQISLIADKGPVSLYLGRLERIIGDLDAAVAHLELAVSRCSASRLDVYEALAQAELARALVSRGRGNDRLDAADAASTARAAAPPTRPGPRRLGTRRRRLIRRADNSRPPLRSRVTWSNGR